MSKYPHRTDQASSNIGLTGSIFVGPNKPFIGINIPSIMPFIGYKMPIIKIRRIRGFSLLELMFVLVVAGILVGLAVPNLQLFVKNNRIKSTASELTTSLNLARSEAIKRAGPVTLCIRLNDTACDSGVSATWTQGWLLYVGDAATTPTATNTLRIKPPLASPLALTSSTYASSVSYRASGQASSVGSFDLCDDRTGNFGRTIDIATTGRVAVSTASCP